MFKLKQLSSQSSTAANQHQQQPEEFSQRHHQIEPDEPTSKRMPISSGNGSVKLLRFGRSKTVDNEETAEPAEVIGSGHRKLTNSSTSSSSNANANTNTNKMMLMTHRSFRQKRDSSPSSSSSGPVMARGGGGSFGGRLFGRNHRSLGKESGRLTCLNTRTGRLLAQNQQVSSIGGGGGGVGAAAVGTLGEPFYASLVEARSGGGGSNSSAGSSNFNRQGSNYIQQQQQPSIQYNNHVVAIQSLPSTSSSSSPFLANNIQKVASIDSHSLSTAIATLSSEQNNEQMTEITGEDRGKSCVKIMKKLFFSLLLGTIIAICWVLVVHILKWIAIKGNEFELLSSIQQQQQQQYRSSKLLHLNKQHQSDNREADSDGQMGAHFTQFDSDNGPDDSSNNATTTTRRRSSSNRQTNKDESKQPSISNTSTNTRNNLIRRLIRRQQDVQGYSDSTGNTAAASASDGIGEEAQVSPVIERQSYPHKRVLPLSSIAAQQQQQQQNNKKPQLANNDGSPNESVIVESGGVEFDRELTRESNDADELISLASQPIGQSSQSTVQQTNQPPAPDGAGYLEPTVMEQQSAETLEHPTDQQRKLAGLIYKAPFFTTWFISIWNILYMPVFALISSCCFRNEDNTTKKLLVESISQFMDNGLTTLQFLGRCALFSALWIGTIFGIVYSLHNIDATVVMALFACSASLVYLLSWVLLHQQFVGVRIVAVIICTTGIALLAYMDNSRTLGSVLLVAGSALCSAIYKVIYQRMFGFWSIAQMSLFFTLIGLFNAFLMWPLALFCYFIGFDFIVWRYIPWYHLTAAGALHLSANILTYFAPICSYNIFLTMGLLFAVLLSSAIDINFYKINFVGMKLAGVLLLMIGFLVCLLPENWNEFLYDLVNERFTRWKKQRSIKKSSRNKVQDMSTGQTSRLRTPSGRVK